LLPARRGKWWVRAGCADVTGCDDFYFEPCEDTGFECADCGEEAEKYNPDQEHDAVISDCIKSNGYESCQQCQQIDSCQLLGSIG
jgi:hypothetical protein